ncbi:MAG: cob(I)alamin adenosyltransferase [Bacteroidota bacterium]|nr:cob(I)alamin adenosyltransferase [Bacteroidota bacterium]
MKIYTRTGDDGTTSISGGKRVPKYNNRVEAYGSVDELISWVGLLRDYHENDERRELLLYIQDQLMKCAAALASDPENLNSRIYLPDPECISRLEKEIDIMESFLRPLNSFIIPGGNILVSYCNITRCVCRRAERRVLKLGQTEKTPEIIIKFLNRLADYLFVLARKIALELDSEEIRWPC